MITAALELALTGGAFTFVGELSDEPAIHGLMPIGYLLLVGGVLLLAVSGGAWWSLRRDPPDPDEGAD